MDDKFYRDINRLHEAVKPFRLEKYPEIHGTIRDITPTIDELAERIKLYIDAMTKGLEEIEKTERSIKENQS